MNNLEMNNTEIKKWHFLIFMKAKLISLKMLLFSYMIVFGLSFVLFSARSYKYAWSIERFVPLVILFFLLLFMIIIVYFYLVRSIAKIIDQKLYSSSAVNKSLQEQQNNYHNYSKIELLNLDLKVSRLEFLLSIAALIISFVIFSLFFSDTYYLYLPLVFLLRPVLRLFSLPLSCRSFPIDFATNVMKAPLFNSQNRTEIIKYKRRLKIFKDNYRFDNP